jgi:RHS repeat-associated protein
MTKLKNSMYARVDMENNVRIGPTAKAWAAVLRVVHHLGRCAVCALLGLLSLGTSVAQAQSADLTVGPLTIGTIVANQNGSWTIPVTYTVTNSGSAPAQSVNGWFDMGYLSSNGVLDNASQSSGYLNSRSASLAAGASYTVTANFTTNTTTTPGTYTFFVKTDSHNGTYTTGGGTNTDNGNVVEADETNNASSATVTLARPDLSIGPLTIGNIVANRDFTWTIPVTYTVTNNGPVTAQNYWYDIGYLSINGVLDNTSQSNNSLNYRTTSLTPGASYTVTANYVTSTNTTPGSYTFFVKTDGHNASYTHGTNTDNGALVEADETNNASSAQITLAQPDLTIGPLTVGNIVANPNGSWTIPVTYTVTNSGAAAALPSWYEIGYLSSNGVLDNASLSNSYLNNHTASLAPGASYTVTANFTTSTSTAPGNYTFFVKTDGHNASTGGTNTDIGGLPEANETNNASSAQVTLARPDLTVGPLTVGNIAMNSSGSWTIPVTYTVTNNGTVTAQNNWYDIGYLSSNGVLDNASQSNNSLNYRTSSLAPGASYTVTANFTTSTSTTAGTYTFFVKADGHNASYTGGVNTDNGALAEADETNNASSAQVTLSRPDLTIGALTVGTIVRNSNSTWTIPVTYTVTNSGTTAAPPWWYDIGYLSANGVLDNTSQSNGSLNYRTTSLAPGASYTVTSTFTTSTSTTTGNYTFFVKTDGRSAATGGTNTDNGNLFEADETNNVSSATLALRLKTGLTLASGTNPVTAGQSTTLSATVTPSGATGTVTFKDGATAIGTAPVTSGVSALSATLAGAGVHSLTASYSGDSVNDVSVSSAVSETVNASTSTTTLVASPSPVTTGQTVTLTATISGYSPGGTVTFKDGAVALGTADVTAGAASLSTTALAPGVHTLSAAYSGDASNSGSTSTPVSLSVSRASATTALTASPNPATKGQAVTFMAVVTGSNPAGTVTFSEGGTTLGTGPLVAGTATLTTSALIVGSHGVSAEYGGDSNNTASTSAVATVTVNASSAPVALSASVNPVVSGRSFVLSATVNGSAQIPTGSVTFFDGSTNLGSATLDGSGSASVNASLSSSGKHALTANYAGDDSNPPAASSALNVYVVGTTSSTALSASANPVQPGASLMLAANVTGSSPVGTVTFRDGAAVLGSAGVSGGVASLTARLTTAGVHSLNATYAGDGVNQPSASQTLAVLVSDDVNATPPVAMSWSYQYDAEGNLTHVVDANSADTQSDHDSLSRTTKITQPAPAAGQAAPVIGMAYDLQDQPASVTDPRSLSTSYATDGLGNTTTQQSPDTGTTTRTFYDNGLLKTSQDARGRTATYTYDGLDRPKTITYSAGTGTTFTYDQGPFAIGHLSSVADESGTTSFTYDGLGHVTGKTQQVTAQSTTQTFAVGYGWGASGSANGKLQTVTYPSGAQVTYGFDQAGRVNSITVTANGVTTSVLSGLNYTANGQPQSWLWGDGTQYQRTYDGYGRLVSYPLGNPAGTGASAGVTRTLAFDAAGRIVGYSHAGNAVGGSVAPADQLFGYDGLDRLTSATGVIPYGYTYDLTGNRTQQVVNGASYTLTAGPTSNRYSTIQSAAGTYSPSYSATGALSADLQGTYTYSDRGRMQSATIGANTFNYLYNAFEQRVVKYGPSAFIASGRAYYVYDEAGRLLGEYDASGNAVYETVYLGGTPIASMTSSGMSVAYIYADHLSTARVIARSTDHAIVWSWGSDEPFGQTQANANPNNLGVYTYNPRFPGQVADAESGWFYNWHRDFNPSLGRYAQSDPLGLGGGINTYVYVASNPLGNIDPRGLDNPSMGPYGPCWTGVCDWARRHVGAPGYGYWDPNNEARGRARQFTGGRPSEKCNKFVWDATQNGGEPAGRMPDGRIPSASEWGDPNSKISGYAPLPPGATLEPGDVVGNGSHVGIYSPLPDGSPGTVSAAMPGVAGTGFNGGVVNNDWGFRPGQNIVVWRPVGH